MNQREQADRESSIASLKEHFLKPGDTVQCVLRSVARSGMSREISFLVVRDNAVLSIDWHIARVLDMKQGRNGGIKVHGCGMDMGFHVVYNLGLRLWPKGTDKPHGTRNGEPDSDGGYALKSSWL